MTSVKSKHEKCTGVHVSIIDELRAGPATKADLRSRLDIAPASIDYQMSMARSHLRVTGELLTIARPSLATGWQYHLVTDHSTALLAQPGRHAALREIVTKSVNNAIDWLKDAENADQRTKFGRELGELAESLEFHSRRLTKVLDDMDEMEVAEV